MPELVVRSRADSAELRRAAVAIEDSAWKELGFLNHTNAHRLYYDRLLEEYADLQLCLVDAETDQPVAAVNCVPVPKVAASDLPPEGWDWLVETGATTRRQERPVLGALAVSVPPAQRGRGYARLMIAALKELAQRRGYDTIVAPVRPSVKHRHAHVPMSDYITWTDEQGRAYDPWLRSHLSAGGRVVRACDRSMVIEEHLAFWETWAGRRFESSGDHIIAGALAPVTIDLEAEIGRYEEPNVWVVYSA